MKYAVLCIAVSGVLLLEACSDSAVTPITKTDLSQARERWEQSGFDSYEITQTRNCYCILGGQPVRLRVWQDTLRSATNLIDSAAVMPDLLEAYLSVDQLFDFIETIDPAQVARYEVSYDSLFGYPTSFYVDYSTQVADEEIGYECTDLHPMR